MERLSFRVTSRLNTPCLAAQRNIPPMRTTVLISQFVSILFSDVELVRHVYLQINYSLALKHACIDDKE